MPSRKEQLKSEFLADLQALLQKHHAGISFESVWGTGDPNDFELTITLEPLMEDNASHHFLEMRMGSFISSERCQER